MIKDDFITIIIPFLNEEENLPVLFSRCENLSKKINIEFEYIFIELQNQNFVEITVESIKLITRVSKKPVLRSI